MSSLKTRVKQSQFLPGYYLCSKTVGTHIGNIGAEFGPGGKWAQPRPGAALRRAVSSHFLCKRERSVAKGIIESYRTRGVGTQESGIFQTFIKG